MATKQIHHNCIITKFQGIKIHTFAMKVKDLSFISYVAVRGRDQEEGAVQRILVTRRVNAIRDFVLKGNQFFNTFILNWTNDEAKPTTESNKSQISIPLLTNSAQIIDGQHRLAGLQRAMEEDPKIAEMEILVSLAVGLTTQDAAAIFLNINTEQRPVPKSLIYDLFGEVEQDQNHIINRANDIASELNENLDSPYRGLIKFPGTNKGSGTIDLSTIISAIKPHLAKDGAFNRVNLRSLQYQKNCVLNYLATIKSFYDTEGLWENKAKNPFLKAAGFVGAIDFLCESLLPECAKEKNFSITTMMKIIRLDKTGLLLAEELKNMDGKTARRTIKDYLEKHLKDQTPDQDEYEF